MLTATGRSGPQSPEAIWRGRGLGGCLLFEIFFVVLIAADGRIKVDPPTTAPGDFIRLRALADLIVGLTACSAYDSCGGTFKPIHYAIEAAEP